jgi:ABC-type nitrate/sulfonate/bicarbonate transport system substrate-binding protein
MQAAWINDAEFAGYFLAIDEGYYAEEGLDLEYLSGGPDVIPESTIIAGRADLALTTPDTTIKAIVEQGAPFKIIGAQYQKNPIGIVSLVQEPDQRTQGPDRQDARRAAGQRDLGRRDAGDERDRPIARSTSCPTPTIRRR